MSPRAGPVRRAPRDAGFAQNGINGGIIVLRDSPRGVSTRVV
jgi:hypothetical protein